MQTTDLINIIFIAQGMVIAVFCLYMQGEKWANRMLALLLFMQCVNFGYGELKQTGRFAAFPYLFDLNLISIILVRFGIYAYVRRLVGLPKLTGWRLYLHWILPLSYFGYYGIYTWLTTDYNTLVWLSQAQFQTLDFRIERYFFFNLTYLVVFLGYMLASIWLLRQHIQTAYQYFSNANQFHIKWVYQFLVGTLLIFVIYTALIRWTHWELLDQLKPSAFIMPLYLFVLWKNLTKPIYVEKIVTEPISIELALTDSSDGAAFKADHSPIAQADLRMNMLDNSTLPEIKPLVHSVESSHRSAEFAQIETYIQATKLYRDVDLNIKKLADCVGIKAYIVSQAINQCAGKNFFEYINAFRIEEAKICLLDATYAHLSIEGIAENCGFASRTAFYSAFKKDVGVTPTQFRQMQMEHEISIGNAIS